MVSDVTLPATGATVEEPALRNRYLRTFQARGNLGPLFLGNQVLPVVDLTQFAVGGPEADFENTYGLPSLTDADLRTGTFDGPATTLVDENLAAGIYYAQFSGNLGVAAIADVALVTFTVGTSVFNVAGGPNSSPNHVFAPLLYVSDVAFDFTVKTSRSGGSGNITGGYAATMRQLAATTP